MSVMKLSAMLLAGAAYFAGSTAAMAADHNVVVERRGMYPIKVYVQLGDTITFTNRSDKTVELRSYNYSPSATPDWDDEDPVFEVLGSPAYPDPEDETLSINGAGMNEDGQCFNDANVFEVPWVSPTLANGESITVRVSHCMNLTIRSPYVPDYSSFNYYKSYIVIGEAPV